MLLKQDIDSVIAEVRHKLQVQQCNNNAHT